MALLMNDAVIPAEIQRFILTSIESIPHLEAMLLLRRDPEMEWDAKLMSSRLYISEKKAEEILHDLSDSGFAAAEISSTVSYHYLPKTHDLKEKIDRLAQIYHENLIAVSNMIHSKMNKQAKDFGNAFKWDENV